MYVLLGIILILFGIAMILFPDHIYDLKEGWKSDSPGEPSDLYRFHTRFGGVMCILAGICGLFVPFLH